MDVEEEWELLPDEGFLEINDDDDGIGIGIYSHSRTPITAFHMNYFSPEFVETTRPPLPIHHLDLEPTHNIHDLDEPTRDDQKIPTGIKRMPSPPAPLLLLTGEEKQQDPVSQVFFKKMKETEFVDIKVDSPKSSGGGGGSKGMMMLPQIEDCDADTVVTNNNNMGGLVEGDEDGGLVNVLKWSLTGIGAICSFGVAAATFCVVIFSSSSHHKNKHPNRNQNLQFRIFSNDKRMVGQSSKLKEAISAVSGVSINRAHITFGGYYDASSPPSSL